MQDKGKKGHDYANGVLQKSDRGYTTPGMGAWPGDRVHEVEWRQDKEIN